MSLYTWLQYVALWGFYICFVSYLNMVLFYSNSFICFSYGRGVCFTLVSVLCVISYQNIQPSFYVPYLFKLNSVLTGSI